MSSRLPLTLLLCVGALAACASPSRFQIGGLTIRNDLPTEVAVAAAWQDEAGLYHVLEGIVPSAGSDMQLNMEVDVPQGTRLQFASQGAGYQAVRTRHGDEVETLSGALSKTRSVRMQAGSYAGLHHASGTEPKQGGTLADAQASWVAPGGVARILLRADGQGGLQVVAE